MAWRLILIPIAGPSDWTDSEFMALAEAIRDHPDATVRSAWEKLSHRIQQAPVVKQQELAEVAPSS